MKAGCSIPTPNLFGMEDGGSQSLLSFSSDKLGSLQKDATKDSLQFSSDQPLLPAVHIPLCALERHQLWLRATLLPHCPLASLPLPGHCRDWVLLYTQVWVNKSERFFNEYRYDAVVLHIMPRQVNYTQSSYTVASSPGHSQILSERFFNSYYSKVMMLLCFTSCQVNRFNYAQTLYTVASFPGHFQILSRSCGEIFYTAARQNLVLQL